jgi:hypothetical protein
MEHEKGTGLTTLVRMWVMERLEAEQQRAPSR